ncbi:hypothetical protein [Pseudomonas aeruginosa]|uniref:hypothetical protein n=1 Tax=Pseudomonas aeruginosa TaxID=287 RepID=UPI0019D432A2|nr:hypothetical protein [Pseudomonas aeruginosa]
MSNELTDVRCPCGAEYPADSYDAGFIAGSGMCQNCDAALPPKDICTCPSGDGSLVHPCPAHPAPVEHAGGDERDVQGAQGERQAFEAHESRERRLSPADQKFWFRRGAVADYDIKSIDDAWKAWKARAALAQPALQCKKCGGTGDADSGGIHPWGETAMVPCDCAHTERAQGKRTEDGDTIIDRLRLGGLTIDGDNAYKRDLLDCVVGALAFGFQGRPAPEETHWLHRFWEIGNAEREARAALAQPSPVSEALIYACKNLAQITSSDGSGHADIAMAVLRMAGVGDDERERLVNEWKAARAWKPSPAQAEQAEAERQEVVDFNPYRYHAEKIRQRADGAASAYEAGRSALGYMEDIAESALIVRNGLDELSAQHERITAKLHDALDESDGDRWKMRSERDAANARLHEVATACATAEQERDAALARVAELERQQPVAWMHDQPNRVDVIHRDVKDLLQRVPGSSRGIYRPLDVSEHYTIPLYAAPVAQAQHSVPETINEEANSFLRIADAGQFKDNAVAVRTAAVIIRSLLHRPALMQSIIRHRIGLTPEYEGQWHADLYGEDGEVQHHAEADTPDEAVRAVVALAAAPGKEAV